MTDAAFKLFTRLHLYSLDSLLVNETLKSMKRKRENVFYHKAGLDSRIGLLKAYASYLIMFRGVPIFGSRVVILKGHVATMQGVFATVYDFSF